MVLLESFAEVLELSAVSSRDLPLVHEEIVQLGELFEELLVARLSVDAELEWTQAKVNHEWIGRRRTR